MKKLIATIMLSTALMLPAIAFATASSAQDNPYPPADDPVEVATEVEGAVEFPAVVTDGSQLAFTGSSSDRTLRLAFGFVIVGAALIIVSRTRRRDDATV